MLIKSKYLLPLFLSISFAACKSSKATSLQAENTSVINKGICEAANAWWLPVVFGKFNYSQRLVAGGILAPLVGNLEKSKFCAGSGADYSHTNIDDVAKITLQDLDLTNAKERLSVIDGHASSLENYVGGEGNEEVDPRSDITAIVLQNGVDVHYFDTQGLNYVSFWALAKRLELRALEALIVRDDAGHGTTDETRKIDVRNLLVAMDGGTIQNAAGTTTFTGIDTKLRATRKTLAEQAGKFYDTNHFPKYGNTPRQYSARICRSPKALSHADEAYFGYFQDMPDAAPKTLITRRALIQQGDICTELHVGNCKECDAQVDDLVAAKEADLRMTLQSDMIDNNPQVVALLALHDELTKHYGAGAGIDRSATEGPGTHTESVNPDGGTGAGTDQSASNGPGI